MDDKSKTAEGTQQDQHDEASQTNWDAERITKSLAHLETLQNQLDSLRSAIPNILLPLANARDLNKLQLFAQAKKTAITTTQEVKNFRSDWTSKDTQEIFQHARESRLRDPDLQKASNVHAYGWSEMDLK